MIQEAKRTLENVQKEKQIIQTELKAIQQRQETYFQLQKQEERLYSWIVDSCSPEERIFFKDRGENSLFLAKKAQKELHEQEEQLKKQKKTIDTKEQEAEQTFREAVKKGEGGK